MRISYTDQFSKVPVASPASAKALLLTEGPFVPRGYLKCPETFWVVTAWGGGSAPGVECAEESHAAGRPTVRRAIPTTAFLGPKCQNTSSVEVEKLLQRWTGCLLFQCHCELSALKSFVKIILLESSQKGRAAPLMDFHVSPTTTLASSVLLPSPWVAWE